MSESILFSLLLLGAGWFGSGVNTSAWGEGHASYREAVVEADRKNAIAETDTVPLTGRDRAEQHGDWGTWGTPCTRDRYGTGCWGITRATSAEEIERVAREAAARHGGSAEDAAQQLRQLLRVAGSALYLEINREGSFEIVLQPTTDPRLYIPIEPNARRAGRYRGGSLSAVTGTWPDQVYVFFIEGTSQERYRVDVPPAVAHVTVVINGREVLNAVPIDPAGETIVIDALAARI